MDHIVEWHVPSKDPAVLDLAESVRRRAGWGLPDVVHEQGLLLPEIAAVGAVFVERIAYCSEAATFRAAADVEFVVAICGSLASGAPDPVHHGPAELAETRTSRALADRFATRRRIEEAAARVQTAADGHRLTVDALRSAAVDAMHHLNVMFHRQHRFADSFTFTVPTVLEVDTAMYEIGQSRLHHLLKTSAAQRHQEGAA